MRFPVRLLIVPDIRHGVQRALGLALCAALPLLVACRTPPAIPPVDLAQPGWRLDHGQAIWRLPAGEAELAGELTAAVHPEGSVILEFTKTPLTLVVARVDSAAWQLNLVGENRRYQGRGDPPARSVWLVLALALTERTIPKGWNWSVPGPGEWRLENPRTGELLRGYWQP
ncbi:MAG: hypothetical protein KJ072_16935 [Verrucomicrobia bacterium]|nr:hypothetical protein [Verrucomicrobiota bacterium]